MSRLRPFTFALLAAAAAAALGAAGCRYNVSGTLPPEVRTVGIVMLRNNTRVPGLESEVTREIVAAFNSSGRLQVIDAGGEPDLLVGGTVDSYVKNAVRTDRYGDAVGFRVVITASVTVRAAGGEHMFRNLTVTNSDVHPESGAVDMGRGQRESHGRTEAARDLGRAVARRVIDQGW